MFRSLIPAALTVYFIYLFGVVAATGPFTVTVPWVPELGLALSFLFDGLSVLFATLIVAVGGLIVMYASKYLEDHEDRGKFLISLFAFMGSMLGLVLSDNLISLFVFWELTGFTSYLLIGFDHDRPEARRAALQALIVTGGGGLALLAAAVLIVQGSGTASLSELLDRGSNLVDHPLYSAIVLLVLFAAFTKSAQFPFHFWLPNAMEAPTPVSAYLHSATMVKAGVYLVARLTPLLGGSALWTTLIVLTGAVTMIGGSYRSLFETDLKRVLAYSTIGALGVLMLLLGIGTPDAVTASLVYLLAHACYKGALFLVAGSVEHETGIRDVTRLGGLRTRMPWTAMAAALAAGSMAGVPVFAGFIAKEQFYEAVAHVAPGDVWSAAVLGAAVIASALLGAAGFIAGIGPFAGRPAEPGTSEAPVSLWIGPLILGGMGLVMGVFPGPLSFAVGQASTSVLGAPALVHLSPWPGISPIVALSLLTLAGAVMFFASRERIRRFAWPGALRAERLYSYALSGLDAISGALAPVLQGASLRSYVFVIVMTAVALITAALAVSRTLPATMRWTPITLHESLIALFIVIAAVSAARAQSTIAAALSLGAVGYGVALMYGWYGAPDLAMTQFAVETLTVVIFVLVFRQLRGFVDLSTTLIKRRDAAISLAAGTVVAILVLVISASGTTSRLSPYFAEAAPSLGHGRNVVNVVLVDLRAFDTIGEITVLVTVAVGVSALLSVEARRRS